MASPLKRIPVSLKIIRSSPTERQAFAATWSQQVETMYASGALTPAQLDAELDLVRRIQFLDQDAPAPLLEGLQ